MRSAVLQSSSDKQRVLGRAEGDYEALMLKYYNANS